MSSKYFASSGGRTERLPKRRGGGQECLGGYCLCSTKARVARLGLKASLEKITAYESDQPEKNKEIITHYWRKINE